MKALIFYLSSAKHVRIRRRMRTKETHKEIMREIQGSQFGSNAGQGPQGIANRLSCILPEAEALVRYKRTFKTF